MKMSEEEKELFRQPRPERPLNEEESYTPLKFNDDDDDWIDDDEDDLDDEWDEENT